MLPQHWYTHTGIKEVLGTVAVQGNSNYCEQFRERAWHGQEPENTYAATEPL